MNITINNWKIQVEKPATVLDIATQNDIYIPSLCDHPELTPYGGCRLCIVEIEGFRGYPTACTTMVEDGMVIRSDTETLLEMRKGLIQLILSEHPAACLMCEDIEGCKTFQETIRKVGITTGCRWCPKDKDCEFQRIVETFNIHELTLPGLYRDIPIEKYDPFFDRDYNLCIYCGRCVRICHEYRKSSVLSLKQRGKLTTIGPAFEATHIEAGCEFCGACVSVCPTGAMSEKSRKWWGIPEKYEKSVCPLCSLNCEIQTLFLKDKIVGTLPPGKPHEDGGELCVKGRFCLSELVNRAERLLEPQFLYPEGYGIVSWNIAFTRASEIIRSVAPNRTVVLVSPDLTNEEIASVKQFTENVLKTEVISFSEMDENLATYINMAKSSVSIEEIKKSDLILTLFLNGNYNFAPLTMAIKSASVNGIPYYQFGWLNDPTTRFAKQKFEPTPCEEIEYFGEIIECYEKGTNESTDIIEFCNILKRAERPIFVIGPEIMSFDNCNSLLVQLQQLIQLSNAKLIMPNQYGNLEGLLSGLKVKLIYEINNIIRDGNIDLLYLIGDVPIEAIPNVKHTIYQSSFPSSIALKPDIIMPTAIWGETEGSYVNSDGIIRKFTKAASRHGYELTHQEIFSGIMKALEQGTEQLSVHKTQAENNDKTIINTPEIQVSQDVDNKKTQTDDDYPYALIQEKTPHKYYNLDLSKGISAFGELVRTGSLMLNPRDARKLELDEGDSVVLFSQETEEKYNITISKNISQGYLYLITNAGKTNFKNNPCHVNIRRVHV